MSRASSDQDILGLAWSRAMLDATGDLIALLDSDGTLLAVNNAFSAAFAFPREEVVGQPLKEMMPVAIWDEFFVDRLKQCLQGERVDFQVELEARGSGDICYDISLMPSSDAANAVNGCLLHMRDITVRYQALQETTSKSRVLEDTLESMAQGLLMMDAAGRVVLHNHRILELMALPGDYFAQQRTFDDVLLWWSAYHDYDEEWMAKARKRAMSGESFCFEIAGPGDTMLEVAHCPLANGGFVRTYMDITRRYQASLALEHARNQLEYLVELRTAELEEAVKTLQREASQRELTESALGEARNQALCATEARTQFLANMSHELRTPLNGVLGVAQLLLESELEDSQREYVDIMRQSSTELLHTLNDLLELASLEQGIFHLHETRFSLRKCLEPVLNGAEDLAKKRDIDFVCTVDEDVEDCLFGDVNRIGQVLQNLLDNAFKFTRRGTVTLTVSTMDGPSREAAVARYGEDATAFLFSVSDTGIGIEDSRQEKIFERFLLGEEVLTKSHAGAGVGLSIAREIITRLGGHIWVESKPGTGSTFYFWLPFRLCHETLEVCEAPPPAKMELRKSSSDLNVLLVEDDPINRAFMERALANMGYSMTTAENGRLALEMLASRQFDLVIMDVQMPEMNGLDATRAIRSGTVEGVSPALPVIGLTAFAMEADREKGLDAGMDAYLVKPCDLQELAAVIESTANKGE